MTQTATHTHRLLPAKNGWRQISVFRAFLTKFSAICACLTKDGKCATLRSYFACRKPTVKGVALSSSSSVKRGVPTKKKKKALPCCVFFAQAIKRVWDRETKIIKGRGFIARGGRSVCAAAIATTDPEKVFLFSVLQSLFPGKAKQKNEKQENLRDWKRGFLPLFSW